MRGNLFSRLQLPTAVIGSFVKYFQINNHHLASQTYQSGPLDASSEDLFQIVIKWVAQSVATPAQDTQSPLLGGNFLSFAGSL